jgi:ribulose-5-phosphate 4-epimerase/fuculose-1-phosphate aldolase
MQRFNLPAYPSLEKHVPAGEWQQRQELAGLYRVIARFGWDDLVFTHISSRVPDTDHHFLINPYGLMFEEITASSLIKVNLKGEPLTATPFPVNPAGFVIHSALHEARPDANCVIHTHSRAGVAVSAQAGGLLPISQQVSVVLPQVAYHDYEGIAVNDDEKARLQADLGTRNCLILRNHGLLTVGDTIANAFLLHYLLETSAQIQIQAQAGGELRLIGQSIIDHTGVTMQQVTRGALGQIAWPALMRKMQRLDPGFLY